MPKVTIIPATVDTKSNLPGINNKKRRVAGYARVSTDSDEQFTSFAAQTEYYKNVISSNPQWDFVDVYTDEGISGLSTKRREGFNKMIEDALSGSIDLIITKSISRFARNTVTTLSTIRELKEHNVECFFEKENIWTFDSKGELLITIMSSLAQEESRSISENVTWGHRRSFENGNVHLAYSRFLGYRKGSDGKPEIDPDEALVVELIYRLFLDGKTPIGICKTMEAKGIKAPGGGNKWTTTTIRSILSNEKYKGCALLQKKFTVNFLDKKIKKNEGEVPQYYVEDSHPAIIDPDIWEFVQTEIERRKQLGSSYSGKSVISSKLICEDCGSIYGSKIWHSTDKYRKEIWQCNSKFKNGKKCSTPTLRTEQIQNMFIKAYNQSMTDVDRIVEDCEKMKELLCDTSELDGQIESLDQELNVVLEMKRKLISENSSGIKNQNEYDKKFNNLTSMFDKNCCKLEALKVERESRLKKGRAIQVHINLLKNSKRVLAEWDSTVWTVMVEKAVVHRDGSITFHFYNGQEITVVA